MRSGRTRQRFFTGTGTRFTDMLMRFRGQANLSREPVPVDACGSRSPAFSHPRGGFCILLPLPSLQHPGSRFMHEMEHPLPANMRKEIKEHVADASLMLRVDVETHTPAAIVGAIDVFLCRWQEGERPELNENDDLSLMLGSLWGEQLIEALGWQWASVILPDRGNAVAVGVFSRDRALALYPFHVVRACVDKGAPVAVRLAFNMLLEGTRFHAMPARGYRNVMEMLGRR